ncbi:DBP [Canine mastadenovirus A]|uniref:DNA-binding protein n=3 Tax=Canine mastadenovirus A TaxID=10537 RepID=P87564_ADECT|nr:DBP [Canine adenovirus 2]AAB38727.1 E2A DNA-binding protein [Canine adenovirus 2]QJS39032.1 DBP [Canine adenovirus 2]WIV79576.1 DBP [Canine mastadenovirus A]BCG66241.1 DBP [Canine mastadenovirus A]
MSHKKVVAISESSSDEEVPVAPPTAPPKKRQRKAVEEPRGHQAMVEIARQATATLKARGDPGSIVVQTFCGQTVDTDKEGNVVFIPPKQKSVWSKPNAPSGLVASKFFKASEHKWQSAMELALKVLTAYQVDHSKLTLLPDEGTLECFKKAVQAYITTSKTHVTYTFTNQKTFLHVAGRLLLDFVIKAAELAPGVNPSGCVVWQHGCQSSLMCLHGSPMIQKEQLVEMDVNSENAQRALKENPEKTKIVSNRWGRNVVQFKNEDAFCCSMDVNMSGGNFSGASCGMFYTDGPKAIMAFQQIMAFLKACYPSMPNAESHLLMPLKCECNWNSNLPLLGRQTCKITPFSLASASHIDKSEVDDQKMLATLNNPAMLVFQCCNPVYRNSKAAPQKNCDFKISSVDLVSCVQIAKQIWTSTVGERPPIKFPEFHWSDEHRYQNTILPQGQHDDDLVLF